MHQHRHPRPLSKLTLLASLLLAIYYAVLVTILLCLTTDFLIALPIGTGSTDPSSNLQPRATGNKSKKLNGLWALLALPFVICCCFVCCVVNDNTSGNATSSGNANQSVSAQQADVVRLGSRDERLDGVRAVDDVVAHRPVNPSNPNELEDGVPSASDSGNRAVDNDDDDVVARGQEEHQEDDRPPAYGEQRNDGGLVEFPARDRRGAERNAHAASSPAYEP